MHKILLSGLNWQLWLGPALLVTGSLVLGWILESVLIAGARKVFAHTSIELNKHITSLLRGVVLALSVLIGLDLATAALPMVTDVGKAITHKILLIFAIVLAIRMAAKIAVVLVRFWVEKTSELENLPNTSIFENIIRFGVYTLGLLVLLQTFGISVTPLITAVGIGGLAVSLALQDTLANLFAGINMILAKQIKIGDYVKLEGGYEGTIEDIAWRSTVIRQLNNNLTIVPNSKLGSSIIINATANHGSLQDQPEMALSVEIGVGYGSDLELVERVTIEVARQVLRETEGAVPDFEPFIRYTRLGDSAIMFNAALRVRQHTDQFLVRHEFIKRLLIRYKAEGIEIPFPQRVIHMTGGNKVEIKQGDQPQKPVEKGPL